MACVPDPDHRLSQDCENVDCGQKDLLVHVCQPRGRIQSEQSSFTVGRPCCSVPAVTRLPSGHAAGRRGQIAWLQDSDRPAGLYHCLSRPTNPPAPGALQRFLARSSSHQIPERRLRSRECDARQRQEGCGARVKPWGDLDATLPCLRAKRPSFLRSWSFEMTPTALWNVLRVRCENYWTNPRRVRPEVDLTSNKRPRPFSEGGSQGKSARSLKLRDQTFMRQMALSGFLVRQKPLGPRASEMLPARPAPSDRRVRSR